MSKYIVDNGLEACCTIEAQSLADAKHRASQMRQWGATLTLVDLAAEYVYWRRWIDRRRDHDNWADFGHMGPEEIAEFFPVACDA